MASGHLNKCKTCCKEQAKVYWEKNGLRARALKQALARDERLNPEEQRVRIKIKNAQRVKKWHAEHPDRIKANIARWAERHPERAAEMVRRRTMKRYAAKKNAKGTATTDQIRQRWLYYGNRCWMCGAPAEHTDHVIALARGGSDWPSNQRPACARCNLVKRDRDYRKFLAVTG